ncbi:MAG: hypothetical protein JW810_12965 [Sedimentisphaerales bacterium]|nr:hypothetical protein [Sedimentisphaerales bacterium]
MNHVKRTALLIVTALISISYGFSDGNGSLENPYQIATAAELLSIGSNPVLLTKHYLLAADINLALADPNTFTTAIIAPDIDNTNFESFDGTSFTGTFNGDSHMISNLTIDTAGAGNDYLGLFGRIEGPSAEVKGLYLENAHITGGDFFSCFLGGLCGLNDNSTISQCHATGIEIGGIGFHYVGGLCGLNINGRISNCYSTGSITSGDNSDCFGGLCGGNSGSIDNCYSTGSVTGRFSLGGLCGENNYGGSIIACYFLDTAGPDNGLGTPLTDSQMKQQDSFVGWDFVGDGNGADDHWQMCIDGLDYPRLAWQFIRPGDFINPGRVDNYDLYILANDWLSESSRCGDLAPPVSPDGIVNLLDYVEFSRHWLTE